MKRKDISNMTRQECLDESVFDALKKAIQKARTSYQKAETNQKLVYQILEDMCVDLGAFSEAENAGTLAEAVSCYIQYGEFGLNNLMREIKFQYKKHD